MRKLNLWTFGAFKMQSKISSWAMCMPLMCRHQNFALSCIKWMRHALSFMFDFQTLGCCSKSKENLKLVAKLKNVFSQFWLVLLMFIKLIMHRVDASCSVNCVWFWNSWVLVTVKTQSKTGGHRVDAPCSVIYVWFSNCWVLVKVKRLSKFERKINIFRKMRMLLIV